MEAGLEGRKYSFVLDPQYRWESWAAPKDKHGKLDHNAAQSGIDLIEFVNLKLFPYLHGATPRGGEESYKAEGISLIRSLNVHDYGFRYRKLAFIDDAQADELSNVEVQPREPYAGSGVSRHFAVRRKLAKPHARFGGRGGREPFSTPIEL